MKTLLIVLLVLSSTISTAQTIEKFSIDSGGASASTPTIQMVYTIGEVNVAERSSSTIQVSEGFLSRFIRIKINPKVFLQGASLNPETTGLMNDDLRDLGLLPTTSPFSDGKTVNANVFNLGGTSSLGTFDDDIVDWIWLEFRNDIDATEIIKGTSALLQRDGDVVALDGISDISIGIVPKNYYIVLQHRNHLAVMSASPVAVTEIGTTINFTNNTTATFGIDAQVPLFSGDMALWAGDVNNDAIIQYTGGTADLPNILSFVLNDPANFLNLPTHVFTGYSNNDVDMNGKVQYAGGSPDTPFILQNVLSHPGNFLNLSTHQIEEQLPEN